MMTKAKLSRFSVTRLSDRRIIADACARADSFFSRFRGMIGAKAFPPGAALFFPHCNDIHMWFMSIPIDVVFLRQVSEQEYRISSVRPHLKPWKALPVRDSSATDTLELPVGAVDNLSLRVGDLLCIN